MCWDNAQQESFWATLKVEFYNRYRWPTKAAAKVAVGHWIERVTTDADVTLPSLFAGTQGDHGAVDGSVAHCAPSLRCVQSVGPLSGPRPCLGNVRAHNVGA